MWDIFVWVASILGGLLVLLVVLAAFKVRQDKKNEKNQPRQIFAIGLGHPARLISEIDSSRDFIKSALQTNVPEGKKQEILKHLESTWEMSFEDRDIGRQRVLYGLKKLWNEGSVTLLLNSPDKSTNTQVDDVLAVDISRFVQLVEQAMQLGYLDKEEAWGMLFLNAQRAQSTYESWQEYIAAFIRGQTFIFTVEKKEETEVFTKFRNEIKEDGVDEYTYIPTEIDWLGQQIMSNLEILDEPN